MKTNHLMLKELLDKYHPKERGISTFEEVEMIHSTLCFDEMDILALRNLRDFVVASMSHSEKHEDWDRMSAITSCIDGAIYHRGGEV